MNLAGAGVEAGEECAEDYAELFDGVSPTACTFKIGGIVSAPKLKETERRAGSTRPFFHIKQRESKLPSRLNHLNNPSIFFNRIFSSIGLIT